MPCRQASAARLYALRTRVHACASVPVCTAACYTHASCMHCHAPCAATHTHTHTHTHTTVTCNEFVLMCDGVCVCVCGGGGAGAASGHRSQYIFRQPPVGHASGPKMCALGPSQAPRAPGGRRARPPPPPPARAPPQRPPPHPRPPPLPAPAVQPTAGPRWSSRRGRGTTSTRGQRMGRSGCARGRGRRAAAAAQVSEGAQVGEPRSLRGG
jgi:hypothetical protein